MGGNWCKCQLKTAVFDIQSVLVSSGYKIENPGNICTASLGWFYDSFFAKVLFEAPRRGQRKITQCCHTLWVTSNRHFQGNNPARQLTSSPIRKPLQQPTPSPVEKTSRECLTPDFIHHSFAQSLSLSIFIHSPSQNTLTQTHTPTLTPPLLSLASPETGIRRPLPIIS